MRITVFAKPRAALAAEQFVQRFVAAEMTRFAGQPTAKGRKTSQPMVALTREERQRLLDKAAPEKPARIYTTRFSSPDERQRVQDAKRRLREHEAVFQAYELQLRRARCRNPYRAK